VYDIEYRIVWPDATEHWIVANGRAHFTGVGADRRPTAFVGTALDITAVRASQHMLQRLTETVPSVIYVYDLKTDRNVYANQLLSEMLGYTPEEAQALGNQFLPTVVHPEDWAATAAHIARLLRLEDGTVLEREYRMQPKGGPLRWFWGREMVFARDATGHPTQILGSILDVTERKQAEQALRQAKENLDLALAAAEMGTWDWEIASDTYTWNAAQYAVFGVTPDQFVITLDRIWAATHPDDRERLQALAARALETGEPYQTEFRIVRPDGELRWCVGGTSVTRDASGRPVRMSGTTYDITARKQAEAEATFLAELGEQIRASQDADALLASVAQLTGTQLHASRCFFAEVDDAANRFTIRRDYRQHAELPSMAGDYVVSTWPTEIQAAHRAGRPIRIGDAASDPGIGPLYAAVYQPLGVRAFASVPLLRDGELVLALVVLSEAPRAWTVRDTALLQTVAERTWNAVEKLRLEAAQRDTATRLQQLNTASLAINAAPTRDALLLRITGEARALIGAAMAVVNLVPDDDWQQAQTVVSLAERYAAWQNYTTQPTGEGIYRLVCDERRPLRLTQAELLAQPAWRGFAAEAAHHPPLNGLLAVPLLNSDGACLGLIQLLDKQAGAFTAADEALLVQLAQLAGVALENRLLYEGEQAARQAAEEASRLKDEFLATVSHELRTPLTALLGYAQLLQARKRDEAYVARTVEKIARSARAQAQLTEDLLDVARIVTGKLRIEPQPIDLIAVIRAALDTARPAAEAKGLQLQIELEPAASALVGDANRLQQVIWNLLSNATKFTPSGGTITLRLESEDRHARFTVRDTGEGISPAFLPYVFDRFRQADGTSNRAHGGLGLGLAIVRHLVELHGGTVQVASAGVGQGATFTVRLPLAVIDQPSAPTGAEAAADDTQRGCQPELIGLRVLVVDDQPDILELLDELLVPCGAIVRQCATAREAFDALQTWRPDVLVSDIAMPGEDGYWLIRAVRALAPEAGGTIPALALTAYVRIEDRMRVLAEGFQLYVPKPVEPVELRDAVARLVQGKAAD
jgi:PAS domain S-box-containing protein